MLAKSPFRPCIAISNALAILVRYVAAVMLLPFTGVVINSNIPLPFLKTWARGIFLDASSKHIACAFFCSEAGLLTDECVL